MRHNGLGLSLLAGVVLGGFVGVFGARLLDRSASDADATDGIPFVPRERAPVAPGETRKEELVQARRAEAPGSAVERTAAPPELPLFSPALIEYASEKLREGWRLERSEEMSEVVHESALETFRETVLALPHPLGRKLAREQTAREEALADARTGGVFALLERLDEGGAGPVLELVRDDVAFEQLFQRDAPERVVDGASAAASREPVADGTTLAFPAGVFRLVDFTGNWSSGRTFPRDVTVTGAGMNATLLVLGSDLSSRAKLRNLRFRDCTLHTDDNYAFDVRVDGTVVRLDRVRVSGFDMGAGASCAFGTDTLALHAVDSVFAGGYGRNPGSGRLFDVRTDGLVARFDRCTIEGVSLGSVRSGGTLVMTACTLRDMLDDPEALAASHAGVLLDQCSVQLFQGDHAAREEALGRDMNDLFPGWEAALK